MIRVLATGTFDILHPGHIYFLKKSKLYGDELHVIIGRDKNIKHKKKPIINEYQRFKMISELKVVDYVYLGDLNDKYALLKKIKPNIITLGFDQKINEILLRKNLLSLNLETKIIRIDKKRVI